MLDDLDVGPTKENIDSNWQSQYAPKDNVYTGSKDDGPGDPQAQRLHSTGVVGTRACWFQTQVGYAPYDFESTQDAVIFFHFSDC